MKIKKRLKNCPVCGSLRNEVLYKNTLRRIDYKPEIIKSDFKNTITGIKKHVTLVKCENCQTIYTNPRENTKTIMGAYQSVEDHAYIDSRKYRIDLMTKHLRLIKQHKKSGSLLDVGCFAGFFLELAGKKGYQSSGLEPSSWAVKYARSNGIRIMGKTLKDLNKQKFDVITMFDVVEHLEDPKSELKRARNHLRDNGIIVLGTPDIQNFLVKILGDRHPFFARMHITLFTPDGLKTLLESIGFSVIALEHYRRDYPVDYYLERLAENVPSGKKLFHFLKNVRIFSNLKLPFLPNDEFIVIARKN